MYKNIELNTKAIDQQSNNTNSVITSKKQDPDAKNHSRLRKRQIDLKKIEDSTQENFNDQVAPAFDHTNYIVIKN